MAIVHVRLSRDHAQAAGAIHRRAQATMPDYPVDLHTAEAFTGFYREIVFANCTVWGAFEDGLLQGHVAIRPGWIDHLYVDPQAHGCGIGTGLLGFAQSTQPVLRLWTFQSNHGARRFYERHGFTPEAMTDGERNEERMPDICYVWSAADGPSDAFLAEGAITVSRCQVFSPDRVFDEANFPMTGLCILAPSMAYDALAAEEIADMSALFPHARFRDWHDAGDLTGFDCVAPLLAWGYHRDPDRWFALLDAWEAAGIALVNPAPLLRWNSDKAYLFDLERSGVAIVPTIACPALDAAALAIAADRFGSAELVVKPARSAGSDRTYRLSPEQPIPADAADRPMLIQPMMPSIAQGELSLLWFGGRFSHAIVKHAPKGEFRTQPQFGGTVTAIDPPPAALELAAAALAACPLPPAYARVDLVVDGDGFALMELELIEPSLFLEHAPDGGAMLAAALTESLLKPRFTPRTDPARDDLGLPQLKRESGQHGGGDDADDQKQRPRHPADPVGIAPLRPRAIAPHRHPRDRQRRGTPSP